MRGLKSPDEIKDALDDLPQGLDETYERMLKNLDGKRQHQIINSLKWLAFSVRPLTVEELAEIFIIRPEEEVVIHNNKRLHDSKNVLEFFSGLVTTQKETSVRLAHFSIKEYLTSGRAHQTVGPAFSFAEADAHLFIASSCIAYHACFTNTDCTTWNGDIYKLKSYAVSNWAAHLEMVPQSSWPDTMLGRVANFLAVQSENLLNMILIQYENKREVTFNQEMYERAYVNDLWMRPHCYIINYGFTGLIKALLSLRDDTNKYLTQEDLDVALLHAIRRSNKEVALALLDQGANPNATAEEISTFKYEPHNYRANLHSAVYRKDVPMVEFLLDQGADINTACSGWGSALHVAARTGDLQMLKLLLQRGANFKRPLDGSNDEECLLASAVNSDLECLRFLLDSGADINMVGTGKEEKTALYKAAEERCLGAFDLLLERDADVQRGGQGGYPLHGLARAMEGWFNIDRTQVLSRMRRLIKQGANVDARDGESRTALYLLCERGGEEALECIEAAQLLIDAGADVNAVGGEFGTPLQACVRMLYDSMARLLLKNGADVNLQAGKFGNALQAACWSAWKLDLVQQLLDHGANVNARGGKYGTALQAACSAEFGLERYEIVGLLLERGADVTIQGGEYGTALHAVCAYRYGWKDHTAIIIRLLLKRGANVNIQGGRFGTALQAACANQDIKVAQTLIDAGADVTITGGEYGSALQAACAHQWDEIKEVLNHPGKSKADENAMMQLLLEHGAGINHAAGKYGSALYCMLSPHFSITSPDMLSKENSHRFERLWISSIQFLLDHGADVNLNGGSYGFPLQAICAMEEFKDIFILNLTSSLVAKRHYDKMVSNAVNFFLQSCFGVDINACGGIFGTALQAAAYSGQTMSVRYLLQRGARVMCDDRCGKYRSAVNAAVIRGHWCIVEILLKAGAKADCHFQAEIDNAWLAKVVKEHGKGAGQRYRKFWQVQRELLWQALLAQGTHVAYYHFTTAWLLFQWQLVIRVIVTAFHRLARSG